MSGSLVDGEDGLDEVDVELVLDELEALRERGMLGSVRNYFKYRTK